MAYQLTSQMCPDCMQPLGGTHLISYGPYSIDIEDARAFFNTEQVTIRPTPMLIYWLLIQARGKMVPHWVIRDHLGLLNLRSSTDVIKVYISTLRRLVGKNNIICEFGQGYRLINPENYK